MGVLIGQMSLVQIELNSMKAEVNRYKEEYFKKREKEEKMKYLKNWQNELTKHNDLYLNSNAITLICI